MNLSNNNIKSLIIYILIKELHIKLINKIKPIHKMIQVLIKMHIILQEN